jgi:hypothetical protein
MQMGSLLTGQLKGIETGQLTKRTRNALATASVRVEADKQKGDQTPAYYSMIIHEQQPYVLIHFPSCATTALQVNSTRLPSFIPDLITI